jgi:hypothetical protein
MEEGSGCCGEEGEIFILKKISTTTEPPSNSKKGFTIKKYKDLPSWIEKADRTYMLNDDRIVENELVENIGGYVPNKGEIFFIDNTEVVFAENQIKIDAEGLDLEVLEGASSFFGKTEIFKIEASVVSKVYDNDVLKVLNYMDSKGYRLFEITDLNRPSSNQVLWLVELAFVKKGGIVDSHDFLKIQQ